MKTDNASTVGRPLGDCGLRNGSGVPSSPLSRADLCDVVDASDQRVATASLSDVHRLGLRHRAVNAFIFTPSGRLILIRRAHNKSQPKRLSLVGGHVMTGESYDHAIRREISEEIGLDANHRSLRGRLIPIGPEGGFAWQGEGNVEYRGLYAYVLTPDEYTQYAQTRDTIERSRLERTVAEFETWLEEQQRAAAGHGEVWAYVETNLASLAQGIDVEETYRDRIVRERVPLTGDLLEPLVRGESGVRPGVEPLPVMESVQQAIAYLTNVRRRVIVHVSYQDPEHLAGGQGVAVLNLAKQQIVLGHDVVWISPCIRQETAGVTFHFDRKLRVIKVKASEPAPLTLFASDEATQLHRERFGDAFVALIRQTFDPGTCFIHLHGFVEEPRRARQLRAMGYHVVSTFHMLLSPRVRQTGQQEPFLNRLEALEREAIRANNHIIVNSRAMYDELLSLCPDSDAEIVVVPNGIEEDHFDFPRQVREAVPLFSSFGRISPEKGFHIFVAAAKLVTDRRRANNLPPVRFLVFGKTDDAIPFRKSYRLQLEAMAANYDNIELEFDDCGFWGADKFSRLDRSWVGVLPAIYEPFGLTLVEYMARGIPVIATPTHGSRDILQITPEETSSLARIVPAEVEALARAMEEMLDQPETMSAMAAKAHTHAQGHYRWDTVARQVLAVYGQMLLDDFGVSPLTPSEALKARSLFESVERIDAVGYTAVLRPILRLPLGTARADALQALVASGALDRILPFLSLLMANEIFGHPAPWEVCDALDRLLALDEEGLHRMRQFTFERSGGRAREIQRLPIASDDELRGMVARLVAVLSDEERELLFLSPFLLDIGRCVKPQGHPELGAWYFVRPVLERLGFSSAACDLGVVLVEAHTDIGTVFTTERHPAELASRRWDGKTADMLGVLSLADRCYGSRAREMDTQAMEFFMSACNSPACLPTAAEGWHLVRLARYLGLSITDTERLLQKSVVTGKITPEDLVLLKQCFDDTVRLIDYGDVVFKAFATHGEWPLVKLWVMLARIVAPCGATVRRLNLVKDTQQIATLMEAVMAVDLALDEPSLRLALLARGVRFVAHPPVMELVVDTEALARLRAKIEGRHQALVNSALEQRALALGVDRLVAETDFGAERGVVWFPSLVKYKVLSEHGEREISAPRPPSTGTYMVQYNVSRGFPRGGDKDSAALTRCPFCEILDPHTRADQTLSDLEVSLGLPYFVIADSRPFFPGHKLVLEKGHSGSITVRGLRELLFIFNQLFPGMRGNIGTGNQAAHLHIHVYDTEFPLERQERHSLYEDALGCVKLLVSDVGTGGFVLESDRSEILAGMAFALLQACEANRWLTTVMTAPGQVYVVPQRSKEIQDREDFKYPSILDAFKTNRPSGLRPRYVGPVEVAGIWLCYCRGDIGGMERMYHAMKLDIYRNVLRDTGVPVQAAAFVGLRQALETGKYSPEKCLLSDRRL